MGMPDFKKKLNIFHLLEFIVSLIVAICLSDIICIKCEKHYIQYQFITSSAFAPFFIMSVIFLGMFLEEEFPEKMDMAFSIVAGIMCLTSSVLGFIFVTDHEDTLSDDSYYRLLIGSVFFLGNAVLFITEFFLMIIKKDVLQ